MAWTIEIEERALQREITDYLRQRIATAENPRDFGKPLRDGKFGLWHYRVRDYRIICRLRDEHLIVLVVEVGHRSTIYDE